MLKAEYIQECRCGAVTVFFPGGVSNSMTRATFEALHIEGEWAPTKAYNCNHCVNHRGIDLCECGSGEPVGKCSCGMTTPSEKLGIKRPSLGFLFRPLPCSIWEL